MPHNNFKTKQMPFVKISDYIGEYEGNKQPQKILPYKPMWTFSECPWMLNAYSELINSLIIQIFKYNAENCTYMYRPKTTECMNVDYFFWQFHLF